MKIGDSHQAVRQTIALVLAGGRGTRLQALTDHCAKPAVHMGGKYRIIDFVLSNCLNSGLHRIGVLTQYKSHSLLRHLQHGWSFLRNEFNEFIDLLPAQQRVDEGAWYRGTADAVFQNLDILRAHRATYVLVLAGDHVYKMDYARLIEDHIAQGAPCTVACIEVPLAQANAFGVMTIDPLRRITRFEEKPRHPQAMPGRPGAALASMGVYVFNAEYLFAALAQDISNPDSSHDFGKDLIPAMVAHGDVVAHPFELSCVKHRNSIQPKSDRGADLQCLIHLPFLCHPGLAHTQEHLQVFFTPAGPVVHHMRFYVQIDAIKTVCRRSLLVVVEHALHHLQSNNPVFRQDVALRAQGPRTQQRVHLHALGMQVVNQARVQLRLADDPIAARMRIGVEVQRGDALTLEKRQAFMCLVRTLQHVVAVLFPYPNGAR